MLADADADALTPHSRTDVHTVPYNHAVPHRPDALVAVLDRLTQRSGQ
ncbi:hypothetical protein ACFPH6_03730 [Streptomyces xiangluensis]|uniref:Uncharacterized protein n=1 Tax=Streptomyces xiangluensis TaxID=2665720 RepID=A0ABV8YHF3_9ACTN